MKRIYLPFLLLIVIFTSCSEKDDQNLEVETQSLVKLQTGTFKDFNQLDFITSEVLSKKPKDSETAKDKSLELYNFKIDSTSILLASTPEADWYTMRVEREK